MPYDPVMDVIRAHAIRDNIIRYAIAIKIDRARSECAWRTWIEILHRCRRIDRTASRSRQLNGMAHSVFTKRSLRLLRATIGLWLSAQRRDSGRTYQQYEDDDTHCGPFAYTAPIRSSP